MNKNYAELIEEMECKINGEMLEELTQRGGLNSFKSFMFKFIIQIEKMLDGDTFFDIQLRDELSQKVHMKAFSYIHEAKSYAKATEYIHKIAQTFIKAGN